MPPHIEVDEALIVTAKRGWAPAAHVIAPGNEGKILLSSHQADRDQANNIAQSKAAAQRVAASFSQPPA